MANFVKHSNCPNCGSKDNLAIYDDGSYYCFSGCGNVKVSEEYKELHEDNVKHTKTFVRTSVKNTKESQMDEKQSSKPAITEEEVKRIRESTDETGKGFRGIRDDIYKTFRVRHAIDDDGNVVEQYYPVTQEGQISGYKIREVPKSFRSKGRTGADCDLFMQFKFNRGGKYILLTEGECLLPSTKVLTRGGWVELQDYSPELGEVMQANGEFAKPLAVVRKHFDGNLVSYKSGSYQITTTPEHNMIRLFKSNHIKVKAGDITKKHLPVPRVVKFKEQVEDDLHIRIQVMLSADFSFRSTGEILGSFKKQRKIDRCRELLTKAGLKFTETVNTKGYGCFYLSRSQDLSRYSKEFDYSDLKYASVIIDELLHWDGNSVPNRNQIEYSSKLYHNAKFIQTCAHLSGYVSTIIPRSNQFGSWYKVSILFGKTTSSTQKGFNEVAYSGDVMCLTMPDGTLLVSENDSISVTGNCDSLSAYQMLSDYNKTRNSDFETAVVSPTVGANSKKQIAAQYKFFDSFEQIIVAFDSDEAGQNATDVIVKYLPKGKVKLMKMRYKDANEYLMKGKSKEFISDFYNAKTYVPVGVVGSGDIVSSMREEFLVPKIPLPPFMHKLQAMMAGGIPLGRIVNLASASGTGKSTIVDEIVYYMIFNSPHKVGIVTLESTTGQYGIKLLSRHISLKLELLQNEEALTVLDSEKTKEKEKELFWKENGEHRFYLVDDRDGGVENVKDAIENLIISCDCKVIVCDPVHDVIGTLPNEEQESFYAWQKGMVKSHNCTFYNVMHTRKTANGQKAGSAGADLHEEDIQGASAAYKSAACNLMFSRNKEAEDEIERNTTIMKATKIRWTGKTGIAGRYYYDNEKHTLYDLDDWAAEHYVQ